MNISLVLLEHEEVAHKLLKGDASLSGILTLDRQFLIQFMFQSIATVLLVAFLYWMLYKPVRKFLSSRTERIAKDILDATNRMEEALAAKTDYEARLADISVERSQILEEARSRAREREQQIVDEARKEAEAILNRGHLEIARERENAADEIKRQTVEIATLIATQFISKAIDQQTKDKLLDEVIDKLEDVSWSA